MKIAVIGIGGSGSAALRHLSHAGHEVVGFEQFALGHARGSSHGESRIIRYTYPDAFHTRLMARAYELWDDLVEESGDDLFVRCGGLTFGPSGHPRLEGTRAALQNANVAFEELGREACAERFPTIHLRDGEAALFQDQSGFLRSTRCILAQAASAQKSGAIVRQYEPVEALERRDNRVFVSTRGQTEEFDAAIVTAGPWMEKLLAPYNLALRVEQRQIVYLELEEAEDERFEPQTMPVWIDAGDFYYGFPRDGVISGVKFASHVAGVPFDPDAADRPVLQNNLEEAVAYAQSRLNGVSDRVSSATACLYTLTPDENFILDSLPDAPNIVVASGCSGHGFKFTILVGFLAAQVALGQKPETDLTPWSLQRFEK